MNQGKGESPNWGSFSSNDAEPVLFDNHQRADQVNALGFAREKTFHYAIYRLHCLVVEPQDIHPQTVPLAEVVNLAKIAVESDDYSPLLLGQDHHLFIAQAALLLC